MIGNGVRLLWLIGLSLPIILLIIVVAFVLQLHTASTNRNDRLSVSRIRLIFGWTCVGICLLMTGYALQRFQEHYRQLAQLRQLDVTTVEYIQLADHRAADPQLLATFVANVRHVQPFLPNHGGWDVEQPLLIRFRSGEQWSYSVAFYQRTPGIIFFSSHGDFFCADCAQIFTTLQK